MAFLAAIGREVRRQRAKRGMTRRQLAQASQTSERYLAQIESGAGNPSVSVLRAIAQALDLPAAALLPDSRRARAALGGIIDLARAGAAGRMARAREDDRSARRAPGRRRPRAADRAGRPARRRQIHARAHARAAPRLAVHRARPPRRGGLRRQHPRSHGDGRHGNFPPPRAWRARARHCRARGGGDHDGRRYRFQSRDLRAAAAPRAHGVDQGASGRAHEPGDGAGRFPSDGAEPRGHGRSRRHPRGAARRLRARGGRDRHIRRFGRAEFCRAAARRDAVDAGCCGEGRASRAADEESAERRP